MDIFEIPPLFIMIVIIAIVFVLVTTASQHRRHSWRTSPRICRSCGTSHPPFARFCRRCGRELA